MQNRLGLPLALLFSLLFALAPRPVSAAADSPYGVDIHAPSGDELTLDLDRVQAAGIGWVQVVVVWPYVEGQPGVYDWSVYDEIVAAAEARHLEILATILYTPAWATNDPTWTGVPDVAAWTDFCRQAAARYKGSIRYWGIWNEPNLTEFWAGSRQQYIGGLLIPGADAIHAGNPDAKVGGPALAQLSSAQWYDWMRDALNQAGSHLDFVIHHAYDTSGNRAVTSKINGSTLFGSTPGLWSVVAPSVREVLENVGWFGRPFWLTETGWQSAQVGETSQAAYYTGLLDDWFTGQHGQDWITKIFFYEIKDPAGANQPSWGILKADGTPKMAYFAYRDFIASRQPKPADGAQLVAADIPKTIEAGETITVSLTFKNTGSTTWTAASSYRLGSTGDADPFAAARQDLAPGESIAPGQQRTFTFPFTAPSTPGSYTTDWQMLREGVAWFGAPLAQTVAVNPAPAEADRRLALLGGRFAVEVSWLDPGGGNAGFGRAVPGSDETGSFWFFSKDNLELVVKALDGRAVDNRYWLFYGALSNVEYWITVSDLVTGAVKTYHNPYGNLCGQGDTSAFAPQAAAASVAAPAGASGSWVAVPLPETGAPIGLSDAAADSAPGSCVAGPQDLCLLGNRFRVSVRWHTPNGAAGDGGAAAVTDETGTFWFFDPANVELMVKVLDGRAVSGKYWVFYGALSDVQYDITVTDTVTGSTKQYHNRQGNLCGLGDTNALD